MKRTDFTNADIKRYYSKIAYGDCWEWTGCKFHYGHGVFRHKRKNLKAHRIMVAMVSGEVPAEKTVNHTCDNPACVNPRHLYVGTHKENAKDRERRGRGRSVPPPAKQGEANANSKITCIIAKDIRTRALAGEPQKQIAAQYGVSAQTVSAIKTGIVWKHIETG